MADYEKGGGDYFSGKLAALGSLRESNVEVCLMMRQDRSYFLKVRLNSLSRPNVWTEYEVDMGRYTSEKDCLHAVGVAAMAAVEHQSEKYGDGHSESEVMKAAIDATYEMLHNINQPKS